MSFTQAILISALVVLFTSCCCCNEMPYADPCSPSDVEFLYRFLNRFKDEETADVATDRDVVEHVHPSSLSDVEFLHRLLNRFKDEETANVASARDTVGHVHLKTSGSRHNKDLSRTLGRRRRSIQLDEFEADQLRSILFNLLASSSD